MQAKATLSSFTFSQPTPELPVRDVERAQAHYRDKPGFQVGWLHAGGEIGAVNRDHAAIFLRRRSGSFEPAVHWVYAPDIEAVHAALHDSGANITEPLEKKPWGLTQFTVEDLDGNRFYFHRD
jgi:catechol 2,3-dioxygenase-like lactoylglutathione lyase family enzyme